MITEALQHCPGIGPVRLRQLYALGIRCWSDVCDEAHRIPSSYRRALLEETERCLAALDANDIGYFIKRFAPQDRWRILAHFFERTSYFDIETMGLDHGAPITAIVCWHQGNLYRFVEHENLDDFLDLLEEVALLGSFNGSSFDVPRIFDTFHIPELPCPHLDLRWCCYHQGLRGGLKEIAARLGIRRPADLQHADGAFAVRLWQAWRDGDDRSARNQLLRYCAADVLMLAMVAQRLAGKTHDFEDDLWRHLPDNPGWQRSTSAAPAGRSCLRSLVGAFHAISSSSA